MMGEVTEVNETDLCAGLDCLFDENPALGKIVGEIGGRGELANSLGTQRRCKRQGLIQGELTRGRRSE